LAGAARLAEPVLEAVRERARFADAVFAPRRVVDFRAADDFFVAFFAAFLGVFFAAVFLRVALRGAFRTDAAFFARFAGARDRAVFAPVDFRADFRAVLLVRFLRLIAVSGSASRAEGDGSANASLAKSRFTQVKRLRNECAIRSASVRPARRISSRINRRAPIFAMNPEGDAR
jgi:hypothetical protein